MLLAEILASLFPTGHDVGLDRGGLVAGDGPFGDGRIAVVGLTQGEPLGVEAALGLAAQVLRVIHGRGGAPILVLVDCDSQRMSQRDELLGLNEYLAHLAKTLLLAGQRGHPTIGLLYGGAAAGAFIATALATRHLAALPGAEPRVMDLPSVARVTKLSLEHLREMALSTPVFAPGLANMVSAGAVATVLDPAAPLGPQLLALVQTDASRDGRDVLGEARCGRQAAHRVSERVACEARCG